MSKSPAFPALIVKEKEIPPVVHADICPEVPRPMMAVDVLFDFLK
jgi:hypothetical protein